MTDNRMPFIPIIDFARDEELASGIVRDARKAATDAPVMDYRQFGSVEEMERYLDGDDLLKD